MGKEHLVRRKKVQEEPSRFFHQEAKGKKKKGLDEFISVKKGTP